MSIWLTSDSHFYHARVIEYCTRPFRNIEEMNFVMLDEMIRVVQEEDTLMHLGDFALAKAPQWDEIIEDFKLVPGKKILVLGNDDLKSKNKMAKIFDEIHDQYSFQHREKTFWCAHIPIDGDYKARTELSRNGRDKPVYYDYALCGHVHDRWKRGPKGEINVGVDVWHFRPVNVDTLLDHYLTERKGKEDDL